MVDTPDKGCCQWRWQVRGKVEEHYWSNPWSSAHNPIMAEKMSMSCAFKDDDALIAVTSQVSRIWWVSVHIYLDTNVALWKHIFLCSLCKHQTAAFISEKKNVTEEIILIFALVDGKIWQSCHNMHQNIKHIRGYPSAGKSVNKNQNSLWWPSSFSAANMFPVLRFEWSSQYV